MFTIIIKYRMNKIFFSSVKIQHDSKYLLLSYLYSMFAGGAKILIRSYFVEAILYRVCFLFFFFVLFCFVFLWHAIELRINVTCKFE